MQTSGSMMSWNSGGTRIAKPSPKNWNQDLVLAMPARKELVDWAAAEAEAEAEDKVRSEEVRIKLLLEMREVAAASRNRGRVEMECGLVLGGANGEMDSMILGMAMATAKRGNVGSHSWSCLFIFISYLITSYISNGSIYSIFFLYLFPHIKIFYMLDTTSPFLFFYFLENVMTFQVNRWHSNN